MSQENRTPAPVRRVRANDWAPMGGPVLPGEFRPLAPTPAASDSGDGPIAPEAVLLAQLVKHYRWVWLGKERLMRWNPHCRAIRAEAEELMDG